MAAPQPPGGPPDLHRATFGSLDWQELLNKQLGETLDKPTDMEESALFRLTSDGALLDELMKTLSGTEGSLDVAPLFSERTLNVLMATQLQQYAAEQQQQQQPQVDAGGDANPLDAALALLQSGAGGVGFAPQQEGAAGAPQQQQQQQQQQRFRTLQEAAEAIGLIPRGAGAGSPAPGGGGGSGGLQRGGGSRLDSLGSLGASIRAMLAQQQQQQAQQGEPAQQAQQAQQGEAAAVRQQQEQQEAAQRAQQQQQQAQQGAQQQQTPQQALQGAAQAPAQQAQQAMQQRVGEPTAQQAQQHNAQQAQQGARHAQQTAQQAQQQQPVPQGPYLALLDGQIVAKDGTVVLGTLPQGQQLRLQVPGPDGTMQYIPVLDSRVISMPGQPPLPSTALGVAGQQAQHALQPQRGMPGLAPLPVGSQPVQQAQQQQQQGGYLMSVAASRPGAAPQQQAQQAQQALAQQQQQQAGQAAAQRGQIGRELSLGLSWLPQQHAQQAQQQQQQQQQQGAEAARQRSFAFAHPGGASGALARAQPQQPQQPGSRNVSPPSDPAELQAWLKSLPVGSTGAAAATQQAQQGAAPSAAAAAALCAATAAATLPLPLGASRAGSMPRAASHNSLPSMLPIASAAAGPALVAPATSCAAGPPASAGVASVLDPTLDLSAIATTQQLVAAAQAQQQVLQQTISSRAASGQLPAAVGLTVEVQQVHPTLSHPLHAQQAQQAQQLPSDPRLAAQGMVQQRLSPAHLLEVPSPLASAAMASQQRASQQQPQQYQAGGFPYTQQAQQAQHGLQAGPQAAAASQPVPIQRPASGLGTARSCPEPSVLQLSPPEALSVFSNSREAQDGTPRTTSGQQHQHHQQQQHHHHQLGQPGQLPSYMIDPNAPGPAPGSARSVGGGAAAAAAGSAGHAAAFLGHSFSAPQPLGSGALGVEAGHAAAILGMLPSKPSHKRERSMRSANPEGIAPAPKAIRNFDELMLADMDDLIIDEEGCLSLLDESHSAAPVASSSPFATVSGVQNQLLAFELAGRGGQPDQQQAATSRLLRQAQQLAGAGSGGAAAAAGADGTPRSGGPAAAAALLLTSPPTGRTPQALAPAAAAGRRGSGGRRGGSKAVGAAAVRAGAASAAAATPGGSLLSVPSVPSAEDAAIEELIQKVLAKPPGKRRGRPPGRRNGTLPPEYEAELEEANILRELLQDAENRALPVEELKKLMRREKNKKMAAFSRTKNVLHVTQLEDKVRKLSEERDWLARQLREGPAPNLPPHRVLLPGDAEQAPPPLARHLSL